MCDHRPDDGESLLKSLVERCVLGVHHDIRARLHIGHPGGVVETDGMEVVSAGSPGRHDVTADVIMGCPK